jgi:hypothetical protein
VDPGEICVDGHPGCANGLTLCGSSCVDLDTDINNCGACGVQVSGPYQYGVTCVGGKTDCGKGIPSCGPDNTCALTDDNCGACGNVCSTGLWCNGGGKAGACGASFAALTRETCTTLCSAQGLTCNGHGSALFHSSSGDSTVSVTCGQMPAATNFQSVTCNCIQ